MAITDILLGLGITEDKASHATISEEKFYDSFGELECLLGGPVVGFELALDIVDNGEVLGYNGTKLEEYLGLARLVAGKLNYQVDQKELFYSIESLRKYLDGVNQEEIDFSKLNIGRYRILQNSPKSVEYLNKLIETGELEIGEHEHWIRSDRADGPRGSNICKRIGEQINYIYDCLGLPRQTFKINHGQRKLIINEDTKELLRRIKEYISQE